MNVLTKAFVVLVTVLAVLQVALIVPFVAEQSQTEQEINDLKSQLASAQQTAKLNADRAQAENDQLEVTIQALRTRESELIQQTQSLQRSNEQYSSQLAEARAESRVSDATASLLAKNAETQAGRIDSLATKLADSRAARLQQGQAITELTAQVASKQQQIAVLRDSLRRLQETVVAIKSANEDLRQAYAVLQEQVPQTVEVANLDPKPLQTIEGQITEIDATGPSTFVQINVGKRDGVQEQMRFIVYRGDRYLGDLVITLVESNVAVGRIDLNNGEVKVNDSIVAEGI